jgi:hypothetical protein
MKRKEESHVNFETITLNTVQTTNYSLSPVLSIKTGHEEKTLDFDE